MSILATMQPVNAAAPKGGTTSKIRRGNFVLSAENISTSLAAVGDNGVDAIR